MLTNSFYNIPSAFFILRGMEYSEILGGAKVACEIGQLIDTKIQVLSNLVIFTIDRNTFSFEFPKHSSLAFEIQPYFGGQATAPHNVLIQKV